MEKSPTICMNVISIDEYGRSSIEGYGFLDLPK